MAQGWIMFEIITVGISITVASAIIDGQFQGYFYFSNAPQLLLSLSRPHHWILRHRTIGSEPSMFGISGGTAMRKFAILTVRHPASVELQARSSGRGYRDRLKIVWRPTKSALTALFTDWKTLRLSLKRERNLLSGAIHSRITAYISCAHITQSAIN